MAAQRGYFITFEGVDGSGKSTQAKLLAARLKKAGRSVVVTREPGGSPGAELIREIVLSGRAKDLGPNMEALLFAAARADHVAQVIEPALNDGKIVISDRFFDSTRAYQAAGDAADDQFVSALEQAAAAHTRPDCTIILQLSAEAAEQRMQQRDGQQDRFESDQLRVFQARQAAFLKIAAEQPNRCVVVDGDQSTDEVAAAIWQAVSSRLPKRPSRKSTAKNTLRRLKREKQE